jgi:phytoene dehydrogenase-like protein
MGGAVKTDQTVTHISGSRGEFLVETADAQFEAAQVVSTLPVTLTQQIAHDVVGARLDDAVKMVQAHEGGVCVVFLGVPESEVDDHEIAHHQILDSYIAQERLHWGFEMEEITMRISNGWSQR